MKALADRRSFAHDRCRAGCVALAIALGGCATYYPAQPPVAQPGVVYQEAGISIGDLLAMLRAGRPQSEIIADVRQAGLRMAPAPADIDVLSEAGASQELLEAIRSAPQGAQAPQVLTGPIGAGAYPYPPADAIYDYGPYDPYPGYWPQYRAYYSPWFPFGFGFGFGYYGGTAGWHYRGPAHVHPAPFAGRPGAAPQVRPRALDLGKPIPRPGVLPGKRSR